MGVFPTRWISVDDFPYFLEKQHNTQHGKTEHEEDKGFFVVVTRSWE